MNDFRPVGMFDSGVGGISLLREAVRQETKEAWDEKMNSYICRYI